jgi:hypothetical protein
MLFSMRRMASTALGYYTFTLQGGQEQVWRGGAISVA